ncbi:gliding motility-associated C-terminal domain-containing protein [Flavobacterium oreochromis]|uniref:gliding motility-associated C-terminal domain-containing protein n=1 Tax=Flavobacterium oreochromis TaxID=2906078 RepID=UPI001CE4EEFE|nr:gliding motility-associated C-terminal domain-containing protein [Flavobacterium oreochromis]QYS86167.1 gliding motility-associated C-terminal domain-containing protein [Flavobacterium oreochromis]
MKRFLPILWKIAPTVFLFVFVILPNQTSKAQCAGNDLGVITVCDIANLNSQTIDLFSLLGGNPMRGGVWSDDELSGGLNPVTGILNVQKIRKSGKYTYTYTVSNVSGCVDNTGTVEVTVGNYTGVPGPKGTTCGDDASYNLFRLFDGTGSNIGPQFNGVWVNETNGLGVSSNFFDASSEKLNSPKTYTFSYTVNEITECPASRITAELTVYPPANSGTPLPLSICSNEDFSTYRNLNLFDRLEGEDQGGRWYDDNNTGELTSLTDSFINIEKIYNKFGAGIYSFTYEVYPTNPICFKKTSTFTIKIEDYIDYSKLSFTVTPDKRCIDQVPTTLFNVALSQKPVLMPDGNYTVTYKVSDLNPEEIVVPFKNGVANFNIPNEVFNNPNTYLVTIMKVIYTKTLGICQSNFINQSRAVKINPLPNIENAILTVNEVCQNHNADAIINNASLLENGIYSITYNLTGANTATNQFAKINIIRGLANFIIPNHLLINAGDTEMIITSIINDETGCLKLIDLRTLFKVKPLPIITNLAISVNDVCKDKSVEVVITGLESLQRIKLLYNLSGANNSVNNEVTLDVVSGNAKFILPKNLLLNTGVTTILLTELINLNNTCGLPLSNIIHTFKIYDYPELPIVSDQVFCENENATILNLKPQGSEYIWYNSDLSIVALSNTSMLKTGKYYVSKVNLVTHCETERVPVNVRIDVVDVPILNQKGELFCGLDKPTIYDLSNRTNNPSKIEWRDALVNGSIMSSSTILQEGMTYYGFNTNSIYGCKSKDALVVTVLLTECNVPEDFFIPDGFSPNGDGLNDTFHIPNIEFVYPNYTIEIYNRYGNLLFKGNKDKNWDGKNSASTNLFDAVVPNDVYFYLINFNKDNIPSKQGRLYLNR